MPQFKTTGPNTVIEVIVRVNGEDKILKTLELDSNMHWQDSYKELYDFKETVIGKIRRLIIKS